MRPLRIRSVAPIAGTTLRLTLTDDSIVERDVALMLDGPVFERIRSDSGEFARVGVEGNTIAWPNGADVCPDVLIWGGPPPRDSSAKPPRFLRVPRQEG